MIIANRLWRRVFRLSDPSTFDEGYWPSMELTGNRELGFASEDGPWETTATSKEGQQARTLPNPDTGRS